MLLWPYAQCNPDLDRGLSQKSTILRLSVIAGLIGLSQFAVKEL